MDTTFPRSSDLEAYFHRTWVGNHPVVVCADYGVQPNFVTLELAKRENLEFSRFPAYLRPQLLKDCYFRRYVVIGRLKQLFEIDVGGDNLGMPGMVVQRYNWEEAHEARVTKPWDVLVGRNALNCAGYFLFGFTTY